MTQRILVATRGTPSAAGALRYARALAERGDTEVEVFSGLVRTGLVPMSPLDAGVYWSEDAATALADAQRSRVVAQLTGIGGPAVRWPIHMEIGATVPTLVSRAAEFGATLIVLGARGQGRADRLLGGTMASRVMHASHVPVLAVPQDAVTLPNVAVVGTDFTSFSWDAAVAAARFVGRGGTLHLAHVTWAPLAEEDLPDVGEWSRTYRTGAEQRLQAVAESLAGEADAADVRVETHLISGAPADEILGLVKRTRAGLIAVGSHGLGFFGRIAMGSVSTQLVRAARCAILVAPPPTPAPEIEAARTAGAGATSEAGAGRTGRLFR